MRRSSEAEVLARGLAPLGGAVAATFVDPGSDFSAFPRSAAFTFVRGVFPDGLAADAAFDVIYSSRCLHVNAPPAMVAAPLHPEATTAAMLGAREKSFAGKRHSSLCRP